MSQATATAIQIASQCELGDEARALLRDGQSADAYLIALRHHGLDRDAVIFTAHWLDKRQAIWWACQCLWKQARPQPAPREDAALRTIVQWCLAPSEPGRRACEQIAEQLNAAHPLGALALAAFCSGDSLAPADLPAVPPPATAAARCVMASLVMAGAAQPDLYRQFVFLGADIAHGQNLWP